MGVQGLLQVLKPFILASHISKFKGKRVAIDGYAWLHKATYSCCVDLALGKENNAWIQYCLQFIDMLLSFDIHVTMVFDGADLPAKVLTELSRRTSRESALMKAKELTAQGDHSGARNWYSRCVNVTPLMAAKLIKVLRQTRPRVSVVVAPYEADAQLAYLARNNIVDAIIAEDSDTIPYSCAEIIFKLDRTGSCQHLILKDIYGSCTVPGFDLTSFDADMMVLLCVGAGCDYLPSVKGFAIKNSYKYVTKHRTAERMLKAMRLEGLLPLSPAVLDQSTSNSIYTECDIVDFNARNMMQYELDFYKAVMTFRHQIVFDVRTREVQYLTPVVDPLPSLVSKCAIDGDTIMPSAGMNTSFMIKDLSFLGELIRDVSLARGIADGLVDPQTLQPFHLPEAIPPYINSSSQTQSGFKRTTSEPCLSTNSTYHNSIGNQSAGGITGSLNHINQSRTAVSALAFSDRHNSMIHHRFQQQQSRNASSSGSVPPSAKNHLYRYLTQIPPTGADSTDTQSRNIPVAADTAQLGLGASKSTILNCSADSSPQRASLDLGNRSTLSTKAGSARKGSTSSYFAAKPVPLSSTEALSKLRFSKHEAAESLLVSLDCSSDDDNVQNKTIASISSPKSSSMNDGFLSGGKLTSFEYFAMKSPASASPSPDCLSKLSAFETAVAAPNSENIPTKASSGIGFADFSKYELDKERDFIPETFTTSASKSGKLNFKQNQSPNGKRKFERLRAQSETDSVRRISPLKRDHNNSQSTLRGIARPESHVKPTFGSETSGDLDLSGCTDLADESMVSNGQVSPNEMLLQSKIRTSGISELTVVIDDDSNVTLASNHSESFRVIIAANDDKYDETGFCEIVEHKSACTVNQNCRSIAESFSLSASKLGVKRGSTDAAPKVKSRSKASKGSSSNKKSSVAIRGSASRGASSAKTSSASTGSHTINSFFEAFALKS